MHILVIPSWYVNTYNNLSGIFFKEQAEALVKQGNSVGVLSIQEISIREIWKQKKLDISKKEFTENGVKTISIQYPAIPRLYEIRRRFKIEVFKKVFEKYIEENGIPNIVHIHSFMIGELAIWIKNSYNIPYVLTEHSTGFARNVISKKNLIFAKKIFKNSSYNIAVSNEFSGLLNKEFNENFKYIPNIVNINLFEVKEKGSKKEFDFINIAFLDKKKNQDMLIKSFTKSFKNTTNVKLTIVGDGQEYNNLNYLIISLNMTKQIKLFGRANREEVKDLLQNADAFVLSSQYETFGVVVIEAMACGLPIVATKCGGPESIIGNDKLGILSDIDENSLSQSLERLYKNRNIYDANYIHEYTKDNFSENAVCLKLNTVYQGVVEKQMTKKTI